MDNNQNQNSSGMMNGIPPVAQPEKKIGPIVGVLIIVLVLIIAALYFFGQRLNTKATTGADEAAQQTTNTQNAANASSSTDSTTLNAELDAQMKDVDYSF